MIEINAKGKKKNNENKMFFSPPVLTYCKEINFWDRELLFSCFVLCVNVHKNHKCAKYSLSLTDMQQMCCVPFLPTYDSYMLPKNNLTGREKTFVISYCNFQGACVAGMRAYTITPLLRQATTSAMTYYTIPSLFSLLKFHERYVYQRQCVFALLFLL